MTEPRLVEVTRGTLTANGREYAEGDVIDTTGWRYGRAASLIESRRVRPVSQPSVVAPVTTRRDDRARRP